MTRGNHVNKATIIILMNNKKCFDVTMHKRGCQVRCTVNKSPDG